MQPPVTQQAGKSKTQLYVTRGLLPLRVPLWIFFWADSRGAAGLAFA